jgi:hypothetical protein
MKLRTPVLLYDLLADQPQEKRLTERILAQTDSPGIQTKARQYDP